MTDEAFGASLRLRVCTWNVGNAPPPNDLREWLGTHNDDYDIIAVGAQEANFKERESEGPVSASSPLTINENLPADTLSTPERSASSKKKLKKKLGRALKGANVKGKPSKAPGGDATWSRARDSRRVGGEAKNTAGTTETRIPTGTSSSLVSRHNTSDLSTTSSYLSENSVQPVEPNDVFFIEPQSHIPEPSLFQSASVRSTGYGNSSSTSSQPNSINRLLERSAALLDMPPPVIDMANVNANSSEEETQSESSVDESLSFPPHSATTRGGILVHVDSDDDSSSDLRKFGLEEDGGSESEQDCEASRVNSTLLISPVTPDAHQGFYDSFDEGDSQENSELPKVKNSSEHEQKAEYNGSPPSQVHQEPVRSLQTSDPPCTSTSSGQLGYGSARKFSKCVLNCVGDEYMLIAKHRLMEIKLLVFVHRKHRARVRKTEAKTEATGIGNVVGNKGAVAVKVIFDDTTFCFVSSHLAAHEGTKYLQHRNADVHEIMRNLERGGGATKWSSLPCVHQFTHIIWMGDLNYRLDLGRALPKAVAMTHAEKWEHVHDIVSRNDYNELTKFDELHDEIARGNVFKNFTEGEIKFMPTFKVVRGKSGFEYQKPRIPSYCDRILWHSLPMHKDLIRLEKYSTIKHFSTSDHKPVFADFLVRIPRPMKRYNNVVPRGSLKCTVDFQSMRLSGLYEKKSDKSPGLSYEVLECGTLQLKIGDLPVETEISTPIGLAAPEKEAQDSWDPEAEPAMRPSASRSEKRKSGFLASPIASAECSPSGKTASLETTSQSTHTRRGVRVEFHGMGAFLRDKVFPTDVPLKNGCVRACTASELPKIPLAPIDSLNDLMYKYVVIVFTRWGSKIASSCVLPLADLVLDIGTHKIKTQLELTKFGTPIAHVDISAELCISTETWIDSKNNMLKIKR